MVPGVLDLKGGWVAWMRLWFERVEVGLAVVAEQRRIQALLGRLDEQQHSPELSELKTHSP